MTKMQALLKSKRTNMLTIKDNTLYLVEENEEGKWEVTMGALTRVFQSYAGARQYVERRATFVGRVAAGRELYEVK